jgi:pimeloyl-ACP methyl ester carboxylesterase
MKENLNKDIKTSPNLEVDPRPKTLKEWQFEEKWKNPKHVKLLGFNSVSVNRLLKFIDSITPGLLYQDPVEGLHSEYFDVYDISPEKSKTEVPVVLGYGWGAKAESEKEIAKNIVGGEAGSERRVIVSDTPHGISAEKEEDLPAIEMEKMTGLLEALRASGIYIKEDGTATGQVDLVGRSEGGIYSVMLARFYPQLVRNLILENPAGMTGKTNLWKFAWRWAKQMKQDVFKEYEETGTQPKDLMPEVIGQNPAKGMESVLEGISQMDVREMLTKIKEKGIGVALITTTEDRFFPPEKLQKEYADKVYVEQGTHNSYYWEPEKYAALMKKAFDELEAGKKKKELVE